MRLPRKEKVSSIIRPFKEEEDVMKRIEAITKRLELVAQEIEYQLKRKD